MPQFRKKPIVIEARRCLEHMIEYGGYTPEQLAEWCGGDVVRSDRTSKMAIDIPTLEGTMRAEYGDYIIKGVKGEFYPCKADIFEATYEAVVDQPTEIEPVPAALGDFAFALDALRNGLRVARSGWNGKGMFVMYQKGYPDGIPINANTAEATGLPEGTVCVFRPYLQMKAADGSFVPWVPSVSDVLAYDWEVAP